MLCYHQSTFPNKLIYFPVELLSLHQKQIKTNIFFFCACNDTSIFDNRFDLPFLTRFICCLLRRAPTTEKKPTVRCDHRKINLLHCHLLKFFFLSSFFRFGRWTCFSQAFNDTLCDGELIDVILSKFDFINYPSSTSVSFNVVIVIWDCSRWWERVDELHIRSGTF